MVERQARAALEGLEGDLGEECVIAYEPIWAIGTGRPATGEGANKVIGYIRHTVALLHGDEVAQAMRILYGGSVSAANIAEFVSQPEIDGALVGAASIDPNQFVRIVAITGEKKA